MRIIRGAFKKFVPIIYRVKLVNSQQSTWASSLKLKCIWPSVFPKLGFHCRRILDLGPSVSHLQCG